MDFARILELTQRFLKRTTTADFQRERAAEDERAQLAAQSKPVVDPLAQDYVAWRRAVLWLSGVVLAIGVLLAVVAHRPVAESLAESLGANGQPADPVEVVKWLGKENIEMLDDLQYFNLLLKACVAGLVLYAAKNWLLVSRSRSVARWAWITALIVPLVVSAYPWASSLDFAHLDRNQEFGMLAGQGEKLKQMFGFAFAASSLATIGPKLFALFPGIMRSSLSLKTLLPEAVAPGWLAVVFAPFMAGFLLLVMCLLSQTDGSMLAIGAIVLLASGPIVYVRRARDLVRPHRAEEVGGVLRGIRRQAAMFTVAGLVLLLVYLFRLESLSVMTLAHLLVEAAGGVLLTMVAISDITLALLAFSQRQGASFQDSDLRAAYEQRLQSLGSAGLTDVESALGVNDLANLRG